MQDFGQSISLFLPVYRLGMPGHACGGPAPVGGSGGCDDPRLHKARRGVVLVARRFDHVTLLALFVLLPLLVLLGLSVRVWSSVRSGRAMPPAWRSAFLGGQPVLDRTCRRPASVSGNSGIRVGRRCFLVPRYMPVLRSQRARPGGPWNTGLSAAREDMPRKPLGVPAATRDDRARGMERFSRLRSHGLPRELARMGGPAYLVAAWADKPLVTHVDRRGIRGRFGAR